MGRDPPTQTASGSEARFRKIIEGSGDGIVVLQRDGVIRLVNPAAERLLGRPAEQLVGTLFGVPVVPGETTVVDLVRGELRLGAAEMRVVETEWDGAPVAIATLRDVTERRRLLAEVGTAMAASLDYPDTLARVARLVVAHMADGCVLDVVEGEGAPRRLVAHRDPDWEARARARLPAPAHTAGEAGGVGRVLCTGQPELYPELTPETALDGEAEALRELGCRSLLIVPLTAHGRTLGAITCVRTGPGANFRPADLALAEEMAGRAALALDNARLYDEARAAVRRRDEFLAMLAHELRNPLAPMLTAAAALHLAGPDDPHLRRATEVIERQGRHLARMLDDLLEISRLTCGKIALRKAPLDLMNVLEDAVQTARPLTDRRGQRLEVRPPPEPLRVEGDATRLGQVVGNLLNNAAKFTPPGGHIRLSAEREGGEAVIRVADDGEGIAPDLLPRVFDLFAQGRHTPDRANAGLGIGLTLVKSLVEMHGGEVRASSPGPGKGSEFVVRLPLCASRAEATAATAQAGEVPGPRRHILVVEDNLDAREMLRDLLQLMGHRVETAADGPGGLALALASRPEVALIDIGLPGLNGFEVARRIRAAPGGAGIRLVALTGYGQPEDRRRSREAGFDSHLVKPVEVGALTQLLSDLPARCGNP